MRFFNIAGEVVPARHYCIPPLDRLDLDEILTLINQQHYFVLHAPRQTGTTSVLAALADHLNATGSFRCVYTNMEDAQAAREDVGAGMRSILHSLGEEASQTTGENLVAEIWPDILARAGPYSALRSVLTEWAAADGRPLIVLLDEIDTLVGDTLISVLRQLRGGFRGRPHRFPQSVVLCGVRDIRDYRIFSSSQGFNITGGSAFNIKAKSLRLGNFSESEMRQLLGQHTVDTGQQFELPALERIWELTAGQPWLTNALAYQVCFEDKTGRDRHRAVTADAVERAKETLILQRFTHLDQLADLLGERRVRHVILPMIAGAFGAPYSRRDLEYVRDLGLVALDNPIRMANPIYAELILRELTTAQGAELEDLVSPHWYLREDGSLDLHALLAGFQDYFREHSESWVDRYGHREAGMRK